MFLRWVAGVAIAGVSVTGLVAALSTGHAANSTKPREIVVVGSKIKKKSGSEVRAGDTLIHRWQRSRPRPKGLKSKQ